MDMFCGSPIMNLMEDQEAPQSARGEARVRPRGGAEPVGDRLQPTLVP